MITTTDTNGLAIVTKDVPRIDSRELAKNMQRLHKSLFELIKEHQNDFAEFGKVRFETEALTDSKTGQKEKFALLNEDHAFLLVTYSRNTPRVRQLKVKLVKAFSAARRLIEQHATEYLPTYHATHDLIKNMGLPAEKEKHLHMNTNMLINKCVGIKAGERSALAAVPKSCLVMAQAIATNAMRGACDHKEAYQRTKVALETFGQLTIGNVTASGVSQ